MVYNRERYARCTGVSRNICHNIITFGFSEWAGNLKRL